MDLAGLAELIRTSFDRDAIWLLVMGVPISALGAITGGTMFLSLPLFGWVFSGAPVGVHVGNIKVGSLVRGVGTTISTRGSIDWDYCFRISWPFLLGTIIGARLLSESDLDRFWLVIMVVVAMGLAETAPRLQNLPRGTFKLGAFAVGLFGGYVGLGLSLLLVALIRIHQPKASDILWVTIQARFLETILCVAAVITHIISGNIVFKMWFYWTIASLIGGLIGGKVLTKFIKLSEKQQKLFLRI